MRFVELRVPGRKVAPNPVYLIEILRRLFGACKADN